MKHFTLRAFLLGFTGMLGCICVLGLNAETKNQVFVNAEEKEGVIDRNIYGQFAEHLGGCIYGGLWVGEDSKIPNTKGIRNDVVEALKKIKVPVLRWPGGCFADEYHWKDGIGPKDQRPSLVNTHWGMVTENNSFGTHEFMELCQQLGCEPYICGNVGSGTVRELQEWVDYVTNGDVSGMTELRKKNGHAEAWKVKFWGVGNESWGCGGNMTPEYYSDLYKRYATFVRSYPGNHPFKIACGANSFDFKWTEVLMKNAGHNMDGLSLHYYCGSGKNSRSATQFDEIDWFDQLKRAMDMEKLLKGHSGIMDQYDPQKRVGLMVDEWGAWHNVEPGTNPGFLYQQNSMRDALVAALTFNIFHQHADRVRMANIAQMVNVLQSMVLTDKEKMLLTPTYHVYEMFKEHQGAEVLHTQLVTEDYQFGKEKIPAISVSASEDQSGAIHVSLCNVDPNQAKQVQFELRGKKLDNVSARVLTSDTMTAHNTFDKPENVKPVEFKGFEKKDDGLVITMPSKSIIVLTVK